MAVFAWVAGDPFTLQSQKDSSGVVESAIVDTAVDLFQSAYDPLVDLFHFAADTRLAVQTETYSWGPQYFDWFDAFAQDQTKASENLPIMLLLMAGIPLAYLPSVLVTIIPYTNPYTAVPALILDAYNIHQYWESQ